MADEEASPLEGDQAFGQEPLQGLAHGFFRKACQMHQSASGQLHRDDQLLVERRHPVFLGQLQEHAREARARRRIQQSCGWEGQGELSPFGGDHHSYGGRRVFIQSLTFHRLHGEVIQSFEHELPRPFRKLAEEIIRAEYGDRFLLPRRFQARESQAPGAHQIDIIAGLFGEVDVQPSPDEVHRPRMRRERAHQVRAPGAGSRKPNGIEREHEEKIIRETFPRGKAWGKIKWLWETSRRLCDASANSQREREVTMERRSERPLVGVIMGSRSDWETMRGAVDVLRELGIPCEVRIVSAHRTPDLMFEYAEMARARGLEVIIAGAGGAAHLPGMTAAKTILPVIGVPVESKALRGLDSLLSIVQMPAGVPVATVAIGNARNAGLMAARILALKYPEIADRLAAYVEAMKNEVLQMRIEEESA